MKSVVAGIYEDNTQLSLYWEDEMEYFIYMTNDCNLHCQYCSVLLDCKKANLPITPKYTNEELALFIQRTQQRTGENEVNIYFFGGEPSLEYSMIIKLIDQMEELLPRNYKVKYILHTNGLLLNKIPRELRNRLSLIMHSINYEKIPKYNLSNSYFSTIINNAVMIKKSTNTPMIARLTITEQTSLYTVVLQVLNYYDLVYWQIENCNQFKNFPVFYDTYTFELGLTFDYWLQHLNHGYMIKLVPFMAALKFMLFPDRPDTEFACGYSRGMVYVQTDGSCYSCSDNVESKVHHIGDISSGVRLENISLERFRCRNCSYRRLCMGRCGRMHLEFTEDHVSEYCKLNQYMFSLFIQHRSELENILKKHEGLVEELNDGLLEFTEFTP